MTNRMQFLLERAGLKRERPSALESPPKHRVQFKKPVIEPISQSSTSEFEWVEVAPDASFTVKLTSYLTVYQKGIQAELSFVVDEQGLLLADTGASEDLSGVASRIGRALEIASDRLGGSSGLLNAVVSVAEDRYLTLFWTTSSIGAVGVGAITRSPLDLQLLEKARLALQSMLT